jgi:hypothetical protein
MPDVVAQVSFQQPGVAPGLGGGRPARQHAKRATGLELWPEVAWAGLDRLRENAKRTPFDPGLQALIGRAETALAGVPRPQPAEAGLIVCPWFSIGGTIVRTIALTARFDHAADVTLDELRAELIYPLDEQADRFFRGNDGGGAGG